MSQKVTTRKGAINEEKEKRQSDSPAKEMKKKMAVTAEKEKQAAEKAEKAEKSEKQAEKTTEKNAEKKDKAADKKESKDKKETQPEKPKEDTSKVEKNGKTEKDVKQKSGKVHNGVSDVTLSTNGGAEELNGSSHQDADDDDDVMLVIDDDDQHDHLFPELAYDTSDTECFDAPTPDAPSRSLTRRSQVKATRTPETPRPASDKQTDKELDEGSKDSKVLKLKEDASSSDRKLRSSDSPKRDSKKTQEGKKQEEEGKITEEPQKEEEKAEESKEQKESATPVAEVHPEVKEIERNEEESRETSGQYEMEVVVEVEAEGSARKPDTNYSRSRVKVSPYRRRDAADVTASSLLANYTGNNTTMEMDITETSIASTDESALDRSFLRAIRNIRGRNSYKNLDTLNIKHLVNRSNRPATITASTAGRDVTREVTREVRETRETRETVESVSRPTAPVVGRKRGAEQQEPEQPEQEHVAAPAPKRGRLLHRIAHTFRRTDIAPEIVGINTDLPLTAPVASGESFDPESLKTVPLQAEAPTPLATLSAPLATPLSPHETRDNKRCAIM